jgi:hypothetical protein
MLACPSVKSAVACHKVCFRGCGLVSLKKRGCLASCIIQKKKVQISTALAIKTPIVKKTNEKVNTLPQHSMSQVHYQDSLP